MIAIPFLLSLFSLPRLVNGAAVTTVTLLGFQYTGTETLDIGPAITPSYTISPVAVGSDGITTYIEKLEYSQDFRYSKATLGTTIENGSFRPTATIETAAVIDIPAQTIYATFAQGVSEYKYSNGYSIPGSGMVYGSESECKWGDDGIGECVDKSWFASGEKPSTPDAGDCTVGEDSVSSCIVSATEWFNGNTEPTTFTRTVSGTFAPIHTLVVSSSISGQPASASGTVSSATRQAAVGVVWSSFLLTIACLFLVN